MADLERSGRMKWWNNVLMLMRLEDYRFIIDGLVDEYSNIFQTSSDADIEKFSPISGRPSPSIVRYLVSFFPDNLRQHYANLAEKHCEAGASWQESEWLAFVYFVRDTARHELRNPNKPIQWHFPEESHDLSTDESNIITPDEMFYFRLSEAKSYNDALPRLPDPEETKKKMEATAEALKLIKENTSKTSSKVKRAPKADKPATEKKSKGKKSKFDGGMGALFS